MNTYTVVAVHPGAVEEELLVLSVRFSYEYSRALGHYGFLFECSRYMDSKISLQSLDLIRVYNPNKELLGVVRCEKSGARQIL